MKTKVEKSYFNQNGTAPFVQTYFHRTKADLILRDFKTPEYNSIIEQRKKTNKFTSKINQWNSLGILFLILFKYQWKPPSQDSF